MGLKNSLTSDSGLGQFCVELCAEIATTCPIEPHRLLSSLTPYEHLERFYMLCRTHHTHNVTKLRHQVSAEVRKAMLSIASAEPLPDFEGTLRLIRNGGKKAVG